MADKPTEPTPVDEFFDEWRKLISPVCEHPLDFQQPNLWLCALCRKWFNEKLEKV